MPQSEGEKRFINAVCEQVRWKQAHKVIVRDLSDHIEDQAEAFAKAGCAEAEAAERAVREMGDPVDVGLLMDASYRPRIEKRLLIVLGLLVLAGVLVRGVFYRLSAAEWLQYGAALLVGTGCFILMMHANFYRMLKWTWYLETGFVMIACIIPIVWYGLFSEPFDYAYVQGLWLLYPAVYALVAYRMRGSGLPGLLFCGLLFCLPLLLRIICLDAIGLYEINAAAACFVITMLAIFIKSFQGNRIIAVVITLLTTVFGTLCVAVSEPYRLARLLGMLNPSSDPMGDGWLTLRIREMLANAVWFGKGGVLSHATQAFVAQNGSFSSDYVLSYLVYEYGYIAAVVLVLPIGVFLGFGFWRTKRIGSQLGKLLAAGVLTVFTMQTVLYVVPCLGFPFLSSSFFPFVTDGNLILIIDFLLAGLLFSLFRTDTLFADPPRRRKRLHVKISLDVKMQ